MNSYIITVFYMNDTVSGREKHRTFSYITLSVLVVLCIIAVIAASGADAGAEQTGAEVSTDISTGGSFSVICVWHGGENLDEALSTLEKLGVKAVFFTQYETAFADSAHAKQITAEGHYLGVDSYGTEGMNNSEFLRWLAKQDDGFCELTGRRPKYCLAFDSACQYASDAAVSYGQRCVEDIKTIVNGDERIENGDVVLCVTESGVSLKAFETAVYAAAARGLAPAMPGTTFWGR